MTGIDMAETDHVEKLAQAKDYLRSRNIYAVELGNKFQYSRSDSRRPTPYFVAELSSNLAKVFSQLSTH